MGRRGAPRHLTLRPAGRAGAGRPMLAATASEEDPHVHVDLAALSAASAALSRRRRRRVVAVTDGRRRLSGVVWSDGRIVTAEECLAEEEGLAVVLPDGREVRGRADRPRPLDRRRAPPRRRRGRSRPGRRPRAPAVGAFAWVVGRGGQGPRGGFRHAWRSRGRTGPAAAGGRIDARHPGAVPAAAGDRGRGGDRRRGRAARAGRRRSAAADAGHPGGDRRAGGRGAGGARLCRARLSRAGAAAAPARRGRADRGRGRRGRAGGGGGASRRRHRDYVGGRGARLDARRSPAGSGRTRPGGRCGSGWCGPGSRSRWR